MALIGRYDDDQVRRRWVRDSLMSYGQASYWSNVTRKTKKGGAIINSAQKMDADKGHTVVHSYKGYLEGVVVEGEESGTGKGEQRRTFSSINTIRKFRLLEENPTEFEASNIGRMDLSTQSEALNALMDVYVRWKDQWIFDVLQGNGAHTGAGLDGQLTHGFTYNASDFDFDALDDMCTNIELSNYNFGSLRTQRRLPPKEAQGYSNMPAEKEWFLFADSPTVGLLRKSTEWKELKASGSQRGMGNPAFGRMIGKWANLYVVEAPSAFGRVKDGTPGSNATNSVIINPKTMKVQKPGMRRKDANNRWTGQTGYIRTGVQTSRCFIIGQDAVEMGIGRMPDYKTGSLDIGNRYESALELWMNIQLNKISAATEDYSDGKEAGNSVGVLALDVVHPAP